jgi:hypothetical protein
MPRFGGVPLEQENQQKAAGPRFGGIALDPVDQAINESFDRLQPKESEIPTPPQTEAPKTPEGKNLYQRFQDWQKRTGRDLFGGEGPISDALSENVIARAGSEAGAGIGRTLSSTFDSLVTGPANEVLKLTGASEDQLFEGVQNYLNRTAGMNQPFMKGEGVEGVLRDYVVKPASEIAPAAVGGGMIARGIAGQVPAATAMAPTTTTQGVIQSLGSSTAAQDVGYGALSGVGGEVGEEIGGVPGRIVGAVAAPLSVASAGPIAKGAIRQIFRGGEAGRQVVAQNVDDFARAGATPTAGEATERTSLQAAENISAKFIGGGPVNRAREETTKNIKDRLSRVAGGISQRSGEELSGLTIKRGITERGGFLDRFRATSNQLWSRVDEAIGEATPVATARTRETLDDLVRDTDVGQVLSNPLVARVRDVVGDNMEYRELRDLRSMVGERLASKDLISDIPRQQLNRLYGAISQDIRVAAGQAVRRDAAGRAIGPAGDQVEAMFTRANRYTSAGHQRVDDFLQGITNKAELDKVFTAVTKGGEGSQVINSVKRSLRPEEWEVVVSNTVRRLGRATSGQQGADREVFSTQKFLTDWDKLGPAKKALFSGSPRIERYGQDLNAIARAAEKIKFSGKEAANPSGSGQFVANIGAATTGAGAVVTGNVPLLGTVLTAITANNLGSRLLTNPHFVRALARQTRAPTMSYPGLMAGLADAAKKSDIDGAVAIDSLMEEIYKSRGDTEPDNRAK